MTYQILNVLHGGAGTHILSTSTARSAAAEAIATASVSTSPSASAAIAADYSAGGFTVGSSLMASYARAHVSGARDKASVEEKVFQAFSGTYDIRHGEYLIAQTTMRYTLYEVGG